MKVNDVLSTLSEVFKYEPREQQIKVALRIEDCLNRGKHLIAKAPTGTGKSIGYSIPAILFSLEKKKKVIISTYTKSLQQQLVEKDLPLLQKAIGDFKYSLCVGAQNYICLAKIENNKQLGLFDDQNELREMVKIADWQESRPDANLLNIGFKISSKTLPKVICDPYTCNESSCTHKKCPYITSKKDQESADILIMNHHLCLSHIKGKSKLLKNVGAIVFDEAHEVEDVATFAFSDSFNKKRLESLINEIYDEKKDKGRLNLLKDTNSIDFTKTNIAALKRLLNKIHAELPKGMTFINDSDTQILRDIQQPLNLIEDALKKSEFDLLKGVGEQLSEMASCIDKICSQKIDDDMVYWKSVSEYNAETYVTPIFVAPLLKKKLFDDRNIVTIHTSATISNGNDMSFYKKNIGLSNCEEIIVDSPFNFKEQALLYLPTHIPAPSHKQYESALLMEIEKLLNISQGSTLILFTNKTTMDNFYDLLSPKFPTLNFFKQGDAASNQLTEHFKSTRNSVLLGAKTFWQGVDIPGDALKLVIIVKIPFANPEEPVIKARLAKLKSKGKDPFNYYSVPKAIILFEQGVGRLIRTKTDKGVIAVLDSRILTERYGKKFRDALPDSAVIHDLNDPKLSNFI